MICACDFYVHVHGNYLVCILLLQVGGVRFLYDNLIESLSRFHTSTGFGCILAHSMGLGKTLQVISFIDIFFRYTPAQHVLCVVPVNTLQVMCMCVCVRICVCVCALPLNNVHLMFSELGGGI